jgi:uncharacterized protein YndB with AHSA1/START domain
MTKDLVATSKITINASAKEVWDALTKPEIIKQYFFGTDTITDWKVGSPIRFKGVWEGKAYEDKGTILEFLPNKRLGYTYWSSLSGKDDVPENYSNVTYELAGQNGQTLVTITQDNVATIESKNHSEQNWQMVLGKLKKLLE